MDIDYQDIDPAKSKTIAIDFSELKTESPPKPSLKYTKQVTPEMGNDNGFIQDFFNELISKPRQQAEVDAKKPSVLRHLATLPDIAMQLTQMPVNPVSSYGADISKFWGENPKTALAAALGPLAINPIGTGIKSLSKVRNLSDLGKSLSGGAKRVVTAPTRAVGAASEWVGDKLLGKNIANNHTFTASDSQLPQDVIRMSRNGIPNIASGVAPPNSSIAKMISAMAEPATMGRIQKQDQAYTKRIMEALGSTASVASANELGKVRKNLEQTMEGFEGVMKLKRSDISGDSFNFFNQLDAFPFAQKGEGVTRKELREFMKHPDKLINDINSNAKKEIAGAQSTFKQGIEDLLKPIEEALGKNSMTPQGVTREQILMDMAMKDPEFLKGAKALDAKYNSQRARILKQAQKLTDEAINFETPFKTVKKMDEYLRSVNMTGEAGQVARNLYKSLVEDFAKANSKHQDYPKYRKSKELLAILHDTEVPLSKATGAGGGYVDPIEFGNKLRQGNQFELSTQKFYNPLEKLAGGIGMSRRDFSVPKDELDNPFSSTPIKSLLKDIVRYISPSESIAKGAADRVSAEAAKRLSKGSTPPTLDQQEQIIANATKGMKESSAKKVADDMRDIFHAEEINRINNGRKLPTAKSVLKKTAITLPVVKVLGEDERGR